MLLRRVYYTVKPFLPNSLRLALRRAWGQRQRRLKHATWPISTNAGRAPEGWQGWPGNKQFALVLTHDVESQRGLERCQQLMDLEKGLGFRSSFNFIPEGQYSTPRQLRNLLTSNGFEVGVHDFRHDGKLYWSRKAFKSHARAINERLREWSAVGFRSAFMLRNLDWLHDLNVLYDSSTFDTDPFEPQPDGVGTIFPFWVPRPHSEEHSLASTSNSPPRRSGYVELPYTLPQDSTLFLVLRERTNAIWKQKLEWVAAHGGMALLNTHPDYMSFAGGPLRNQFDVTLYKDFLGEIKEKYDGAFWHALPREIAAWMNRDEQAPARSATSNQLLGIT
jgi:hypothetical protein